MSSSSTKGHGSIEVRSRFGPIRIELLDHRLNRISLGFGELRASVPAGLYTLQYSAGSVQKDEILRVESGGTVRREVDLPFPTVAPLSVSSSTHEFHTAPAISISKNFRRKYHGTGGCLLIFARTIDGDGRAPVPIEQLSLWDSALQPVGDLPNDAQRDDQYGWAALCAELKPGGYALRWRQTNRSARGRGGRPRFIDQSLWVASGWTTMVFIGYRSEYSELKPVADALGPAHLLVPSAETGLLERQSASVHMARLGQSFNPGPHISNILSGQASEQELRGAKVNQALDLALSGLRAGTRIIPDDLIALLLDSKFQNPMLGIIGAHALLQRSKPDWKIFDTVVRKLGQIVPDHPDVIALRLLGKIGRGKETKTRIQPLAWPPMVYSGYKGLIERDWSEQNSLVIDESVAERAAAALLPESPWTCWLALEESRPPERAPRPESRQLGNPKIQLPGLSHFIKIAADPETDEGRTVRQYAFAAKRIDLHDYTQQVSEKPDPAVERVSRHIAELKEMGDEVDLANLKLEDFRQLGLPVSTVEKAIETLMSAPPATPVTITPPISAPSENAPPQTVIEVVPEFKETEEREQATMPIDKKFYIHTGKDGILDDMTEDDVRALVDDLKTADKVVIHLHGGLVSQTRALEKAERLTPAYQAAGARPVFMVWESGFFETIPNNLHEINKEKIFTFLVKRVLKYAAGKLTNIGGSKSGGQLPLPKDIEVSKEFNKRLGAAPDGPVPFGSFEPDSLEELTEAERKRFEDSLATDPEFQNEVQAIVDAARPELTESTSKGITVKRQKSTQTLMSPEVVDELVADAADKEGKGIFSSAAMILKAGQILWRVIDRFRHGRDHGLYTTVVEEVLREYYIANVGAFVWGSMKKDTEDTFANVGQQPTRAGWFFVQELGRMMKEGHRPEVSVVAHSAGAIYASHLLAHLAWARADQNHPLPDDFCLKNLIFLAPACTFTVFDRALAAHRQSPLFEHFRMFSLSDSLEAGYWEVPGVYPRSLLYFVSGVVEQENGQSAIDLPLLGMQRYFTNVETYQQPEVERVRSMFSQIADKRGEVWSEENRGDGLTSDAIKHGGFDSTEDPAKTIASIQHILKSGW